MLVCKDDYFVPVATALIEQGFVKVNRYTSERLNNINRDDIVMLKSF